jgi:hypothetical protein
MRVITINACRQSIFHWQARGDGDPRGDYSPLGDGDGEKKLSVSISGDGGGEFTSPRGRGWEAIPRRGIPRCHP